MEQSIQKITKLFDPDFAKSYIAKNSPYLGEKINLDPTLTITPIKSNIGVSSYHVVIRYDSKSIKGSPIFCSAHSEENRENAYRALLFIQSKSKANKNFITPVPMFFDKEINAFFYQGYNGKNLLYYLKNPLIDISGFLKKTALWASSLHSLPTDGAENYNHDNSKIKTTIPGPEKFLTKIKRLFPELFDKIKAAFEKISSKEEEILSKLDKKCLIHGDLHPENVIITKNGEVSVIDFTDMCLSDWTRDVGNFIQQLGYMSRGTRNKEYIARAQKIFYEEYLKNRGIKETDEIKNRVDLYKSWSSLRSTIYFLTKASPEPENAKATLCEININKL